MVVSVKFDGGDKIQLMKAEHTVSTLRICIDEMQTEESDIKGRIYGIAVKDEITFSGSSELFVMIDRLLDKIGKPQPSRKSRSFREEESSQVTSYCYKPEQYHTQEEILKEKGNLITRDIIFISRLRSSWQGIVKDEEGKLLGEFDSDLEFISLLYDRGVTF